MDIELGFENIATYLSDNAVPRLDKFELLLNENTLSVVKEYSDINIFNESMVMKNCVQVAMGTEKPSADLTADITGFFQNKDIPFEEKMALLQMSYVQEASKEFVENTDDPSKSQIALKDRWKNILSGINEDVCFKNYKGNSDIPESFFGQKAFSNSDSYVRPLSMTRLAVFYKQKHSMIFHDHMRRKTVSTSILHGLYSENRSVTDYIDGRSNAVETKRYLFGLFVKETGPGELVDSYGDVKIDPMRLH
jgi:hypothetical protein